MSNFWILKQYYFIFIPTFSFGRILRKRNQHILLSAIKSTQISTEGRLHPIPDIPTSAEILVYSFRRINFTTFSDIIHTNHLSIYFHFALLFFQCVDITLWKTQNTLRKHYTLRKNIHFRFSKHFEKTLHIEKSNHSGKILHIEKFETLWKNITHWETQITLQ